MTTLRNCPQKGSQHLPGVWADFAYNFAVCLHGYVFEGRGLNAQNAANGNEDLNRNHFAVLAFVGSHLQTVPTQECITGIQDAVAYLRRHGAGWEIAGHRDGYSTECPGDPLYGLVLDDTLDPGVLWDGGTHVVAAGHTVDSISLNYNMPKSYIISVNGLEHPFDLTVGQEIEIPARGVPLTEEPPPPDDAIEFTPFPGEAWFKSSPESPIVRAMGEELVARDCDAYASDPDSQWSDEDRASYRLWQEKLGFTGPDADGWPGPTSWERLRVPRTS